MTVRDCPPPFQFELQTLVGKARRHVGKRVDGVTINLPFVSFSVRPDDVEQKAAREIVIRLADKRVLNAFECCDDCIERALASLQEIRSLLVDKQVELADLMDGALYLLIEFMLEAIRQFFTFEERLSAKNGTALPGPKRFAWGYDREAYFGALEMLRAHLYRCLSQVAALGSTQVPKIADNMRYDSTWQLEAYASVPQLEAE